MTLPEPIVIHGEPSPVQRQAALIEDIDEQPDEPDEKSSVVTGTVVTAIVEPVVPTPVTTTVPTTVLTPLPIAPLAPITEEAEKVISSDESQFVETDDEPEPQKIVETKKSVEFSPNVTVKTLSDDESEDDEEIHYGDTGQSPQLKAPSFLAKLCSSGVEEDEDETIEPAKPHNDQSLPPPQPPASNKASKSRSCILL